MVEDTEVIIGLDVAKAHHAVAIAEDGRRGEVRFLVEIDAAPTSVRRLVSRLEKHHTRLHFCYEAGPTGYGLHRQLTAMGHRCTVVAPSLIPRKPGDRVKTNRRDALQLARLLRNPVIDGPSLQGKLLAKRRSLERRVTIALQDQD
jgi:transposase